MKGQQGPRRRRLTYANVVSTLALLLAISGGTAYAASKLIKGSQIAKGTITATNIKSGTLLSKDFKKGQIPKGARGANGANGANGAAGTAIAFGTMLLNGPGNPTFEPGTVGFTSVTTPQADVYCVPIPAGAAGRQPLLSDAGGNNDAVFSLASPQQCPGDYEVVQESGTNITSGQGFVIAVP